MSMFGAMFAPRPEFVAAELLRVCRSGGVIAMANWTREGFVGQMFAVTGRHVSSPPGVPSPLLWGDETTFASALGSGSTALKLSRQNMEFDYPFAPKQVVDFFRNYYGPTNAAFAHLDEQRQAALAADLEATGSEKNQAAGDRTHVYSEYLEVMPREHNLPKSNFCPHHRYRPNKD